MADHTIAVLSTLLESLPIGTNLALLHFVWMLVSGALLPNRGAIFPALKATGLSDEEMRRAWAAFRKGVWRMPSLLASWRACVKGLPGWQDAVHPAAALALPEVGIGLAECLVARGSANSRALQHAN